MPSENQKQGKKGEQIAAEYLISKGYNILEQNLQIGHWEIDLVASTAEFLVIIEVKTRKSSLFGEPEAFVTRPKQRNLINATNVYIVKNGITKEVRFDIISVVLGEGIEKVKHIENAFTPSW